MKIYSALTAGPPTKKTEHWKMKTCKSLTKAWARGMESNCLEAWTTKKIFIRDEERVHY